MTGVRADRMAAAAERAVADTCADGQVPGVIAGITTASDTVYLGAAGRRAADGDTPMTTDTVIAAFSTTKALTATVALRLVEDGSLDLDAPAVEYQPRLADLGVIDGFDDAGEPVLREPLRPVTMRHLLTHTAGFGYDFFDDTYARLTAEHGVPGVITATLASLRTPLLFDPGSRWLYGSNLDWAGLVIEGATGRRLGDVMADRMLRPLGMSDTAFDRTPSMRERTATMHHRRPDGSLKANHRWSMADDPEVQMGGQGLYTTVGDYLRFLRMWLARGTTESGEQLLRPDTVTEATRDQLGGLSVTGLHSVIPAVTHDFEFFPRMPKTWGLTGMITEQDAPTGRPAGSIGWAGLANLYYWIDSQNGIGGFWATQVMPFADRVAYDRYLAFETAVYDALP